MEEKTKKRVGKLHSAAFISALVIGIMLGYTIMPSIVLMQDDEGEWHVVMKWNSAEAAEATPGANTSGWLAFFCLDYAQVPGTALAFNGTGASSYDLWANNVSGYCSTDDQSARDLRSDDPFFFVCRARFNDTVKDAGLFIAQRCRCTLTVTGDETITAVKVWGHNTTAGRGGGVVSENISTDNYIYINFYWDDGVNGYRITDDGTLTWAVTIEAKY